MTASASPPPPQLQVELHLAQRLRQWVLARMRRWDAMVLAPWLKRQFNAQRFAQGIPHGALRRHLTRAFVLARNVVAGTLMALPVAVFPLAVLLVWPPMWKAVALLLAVFFSCLALIPALLFARAITRVTAQPRTVRFPWQTAFLGLGALALGAAVLRGFGLRYLGATGVPVALLALAALLLFLQMLVQLGDPADSVGWDRIPMPPVPEPEHAP